MRSLRGRGPLVARRAQGAVPLPQPPRRDPAPSIWSYRAQRLWLTPLFHRLLWVGLPVGIVVGAVALFLADGENRAAISEGVAEIRAEIEARPEFQVTVMDVEGASDVVRDEIRVTLGLELPMSSFDLDLKEMRARIEALPPVAEADLRINSGGFLSVRVVERQPALVWQTRDGMVLIDDEGHFVAGLETRAPGAPLPMIAGEGADRVVDEALSLHAAAAPLGDDLLGLARMGDRRWDVVLRDGRRIALPETGAVAALDRALALEDVADLLSRDILRIDLRNPDRMTVQLGPDAVEGLRLMRGFQTRPVTGESDG